MNILRPFTANMFFKDTTAKVVMISQSKAVERYISWFEISFLRLIFMPNAVSKKFTSVNYLVFTVYLLENLS